MASSLSNTPFSALLQATQRGRYITFFTLVGDISFEFNTPEKALEYNYSDFDFFPNIHTLLKVMGTLPVTIGKPERSFNMLIYQISTKKYVPSHKNASMDWQ